jgi:hypothetical protein
MSTSVPASVEALYRSMRWSDLHVLREAFVRDRDTGAARAFCKSRIAIIDRILREEPCEHLFEDGGTMCLRCGAVR